MLSRVLWAETRHPSHIQVDAQFRRWDRNMAERAILTDAGSELRMDERSHG